MTASDEPLSHARVGVRHALRDMRIITRRNLLRLEDGSFYEALRKKLGWQGV